MYSITMATFPDRDAAKKIAKLLVEKRLAPCVQIFPIDSVYLWEDKREFMLLIKSKTALFDRIASAIKENHAYEMPEIVQTPITDGLPEYLRWIDKCAEGDG